MSLLGWGCREARSRYGEGTVVSLGAVGTGALGDEPVYRGAGELREDVAVAIAAGIERLALFDLGGVLSRPPAEAWLEAFVEAPVLAPPDPAPSLRARCAVAAAIAAGAIARSAARARPW
jgi:hypothetical protein